MTELLLNNLYLKIDGADVSAELMDAIEEVTAETSLHLPDMLTMVIYDPRLRWVDDTKLSLGRAIEASFKAGNSTNKVFEGEIVEVELELEGDAYRVTVRALNKLHRLARGSKNRTFLQVTDADLATRIAQENGLRATADGNSPVWKYALQAGESDLQFLQRRAAARGCLLYVKNGTLVMKAPEKPGAATATLTAGQNLTRFRARASTLEQLDEVTVRGWSTLDKKEVVGKETTAAITPQVGEIKKQWFSKATLECFDVGLTQQDDAKRAAAGHLLRRASRFVEADGTAFGVPNLVAGSAVTLEAVGTRFSGSYYVTSATHRYNPRDGYMVDFSVSGANPATLLAAMLPEQPAATLSGLFPAVVTNLNDPDNLGRVKVKLVWLGADVESDWARVLAIGAGPTRGVQWMPEINDEVLVGFSGGVLSTPFVLGNLWNGKDQPPLAASAFAKSGKVVKRTLRTTTGHEITFDDDTSAGGILIKDKKGNTIEIKSQEDLITISSKGDIKFSAQKTITMEAQTAITMESKGSMDVKSTGAMTVESQATLGVKGASELKLEGTGGATLKSSASTTVESSGPVTVKGALAKLESSGITEVKGTLVKLN